MSQLEHRDSVIRLNQKIYKHIEAWRNRTIEGEFPYVYLDGVVLKPSWAGEVRNISVLVAIGGWASGFAPEMMCQPNRSILLYELMNCEKEAVRICRIVFSDPQHWEE